MLSALCRYSFLYIQHVLFLSHIYTRTHAHSYKCICTRKQTHIHPTKKGKKTEFSQWSFGMIRALSYSLNRNVLLFLSIFSVSSSSSYFSAARCCRSAPLLWYPCFASSMHTLFGSSHSYVYMKSIYSTTSSYKFFSLGHPVSRSHTHISSLFRTHILYTQQS